MLVFSRLKTSKDIANCSNATPFFRELLLPELPSLLFPEVFPIFMKTMYNADECDPDFNPTLFKQHLNCRQVNKRWCQGIDQYLEKQPYMERYRFGDISCSEFLHHFKATHENSLRSPFVGKHVSVFDRQVPEDINQGDERFIVPGGLQASTKEVICTYGSHIMHLTCYSHSTLHGSTTKLLDIISLLRFTPNLISLNLFLVVDPAMEMAEDEIEIPKLDKLQSVTCVTVYPKVLNKLLKSNPHISRLSCGVGMFAGLDFQCLELPNLLHMKIISCTESELLRFAESNAANNLEYLTVNLENNEFENLPRIFKAIDNKWTASLQKLQIRFTQYTGDRVPETEFRATGRFGFNFRELIWFIIYSFFKKVAEYFWYKIVCPAIHKPVNQ